MVYGFNDIRQAFTGAIIASLLVVLVRAGQPISIDPSKGFIIGIIWIWIVTSPFITNKMETKVHAVGNLLVTLVVTTILSLSFDLVTVEQLSGFGFFGTTPWIIMMLALPTASFWDRNNITNQYDRWYLRKR